MDCGKTTDEQFAEAAKARPGAAIEYAKDRYERLKSARKIRQIAIPPASLRVAYAREWIPQ